VTAANRQTSYNYLYVNNKLFIAIMAPVNLTMSAMDKGEVLSIQLTNYLDYSLEHIFVCVKA
jgi:hypothetical protein